MNKEFSTTKKVDNQVVLHTIIFKYSKLNLFIVKNTVRHFKGFLVTVRFTVANCTVLQ